MDIHFGETNSEWVGYAIAALLLCGVGTMLWARQARLRDRHTEIVVDASSDQSTIESIISAQHGMNKFREMIQATNIAILKIWSILVSKAPKVIFIPWLYSDNVYSSVLPISFFSFFIERN